ncbi:MAG: thymidine phosphorylase [Spirochaetales bacterium]|nr:thymidine phosphorylase [Spirochaetales bacterium]
MTESLRTVDIIAAKRDGRALTENQISHFIQGYADGSIPDYQAAAWCMATFLNGMTPQETGYLTRAMIHSGDVMDLSLTSGPFVDKHSTGGVGDKLSLILAPIVAACGVKVPMMSGRALGHTGGTLDKLDAIPGYTTALTPERFAQGVAEVGFAMTGQSEKVVPADRKMYALRDVIATVESIPLITASILSKKFAEGSDALVMDVKCGRGAFMKTPEAARALAESLVRTGESLGRKVVAVLTDMSEPLGRMVGNFLEVEESVACLQGQGPADVMEITLRLAAWMVVAAGIEPNVDQALVRCQRAIEDGSAMAKFRENLVFQGGSLDEFDAMLGTARANYSVELNAESSGFVEGIDAFSVGMAGVALGVGRDTASDPVEPLAGIEVLKKIGEPVTAGEPLLRLWAEDKERLEAGLARIQSSVSLSKTAPQLKDSLILEEMSSK